MGFHVRVRSFGAGRTSGVGGKIGQTVFGLVFGGMGLLFQILVLRGAVEHLRTQAWTPTRCVIEAADVRESGDDYTFAVRYTYDYAGRRYSGERYRGKHPERFDDVATKQRLLARYVPGREAQCFVDPHAPSNAVLDRSGSILPHVGGALFASVFVLIGFGVAVAAWRRPRTAVAATAGATTARQGTWVVAVFCSVFIAIGVVVPYFTFVRPLMRQRAAQAWVPVEARVERSLVKSHRGDDSTTYSVYIAYRYRYDGHDYEGDRYDFAGGSSSGYEAKAAVVRAHPVGSTLTVFVDPSDPIESVVLRDAGAKIYLGLIPVVFAVFGALFLALFRRSQARTATGLPGATRQAGARRHARPVDATPALQRSSTRAGRVFGITFAALFWNGIVSVFLFHVVQEWRRGRRPVFLTLFLTPFVLVGAALLAGIVREVLRLFNPRFELEPPSEPLMPGSEVELEFHVVGNVRRLTDLRIWLTAREEATYRRGTNSYTDRNEFLKRRLFETKSPRKMETGKITLAIPADAMHSFTASSNKVVWSLKVEGAIPRWPDLSEEFVVTVVPKEERPWATKSA